MSDSTNNTRDSEQDGEPSGKIEQSATKEEIEAWEEEHDGIHPIFEVNHRPERSQGVVGDVSYCTNCGSDIDPENTEVKIDTESNQYRTEFVCDECDYHGEVFRHE